MQNAIRIENDYETQFSTLKFILLTIVTCGFYYYYWSFNFIKTFNKKTTITIISPVIFLIAIAITEWSTVFDPSGVYAAHDAEYIPFVMVYLAANLVALALCIYIAFSIHKHLEVELNKSGYNIKVHVVPTIVFQFFYFYYLLHNCEVISNKNDFIRQQRSVPDISDNTNRS